MDISFSFSSSPWILPVLTGILLLLTYWYYRKTLPPSKGFLRFGLMILRGLVLFLITFLLCKPLIHIEKSVMRPAVAALLVDQSASMQIIDEDLSRGKILENVIRSPCWKSLLSRIQLKSYAFSDNVFPFDPFVHDSLDFSGSGTNLGAALQEIHIQNRDEPLSCFLLLTDGANNAGDDPPGAGEMIGLPIYSICFGQAEQKPDLILSRIQTNNVTYVDHQVPVEITLRGPGFGGNKGSVILKQDQKILERRTVSIPPDGLEQTIRFVLTPRKDGILRFQAIIESAAGEMTLENNEKEFYVTVLKNKFQVLLLAGRPSPDLSFLKRYLDEDNNIDLRVLTGKQGHGYYEGQFPDFGQIENKDLFILLNFPDSETPEIHWEIVKRALLERYIPFFLLAGKEIDRNRLSSIEALLAIPLPGQVPERFIFPVPTRSGEIHSVVRITESLTDNREMWRQLPPVYSNWDGDYSDLNMSLLTGFEDRGAGNSGNSNVPLLLFRHQEKEKSLLFLGYGFYRWDLLMWGIGETNTVFKRFVENSIRWLATREQERRVRLSTDKRVYEAGEEIHFTAQITDETFHPLDNACVSITVITPAEAIQYPLNSYSQGLYQSSKRFFYGGPYRAVVEASIQNHPVGKDTTQFTVTSFNSEFLHSRANPGLLNQLAQMTGAKSGPPDSLSSILESIQFPQRTVSTVREIELFHWPLILLVLVPMLACEWWMRKRRGML